MTTMTEDQNSLTPTELTALRGLALRGWTVVAFSPSELNGVDADDLQGRLIQHGWNVIDGMKDQP